MGRLPYASTDADLRREFEMYGPLERIRVVRNKDGKSRGYAFLIYEREKDMKGALLAPGRDPSADTFPFPLQPLTRMPKGSSS